MLASNPMVQSMSFLFFFLHWFLFGGLGNMIKFADLWRFACQHMKFVDLTKPTVGSEGVTLSLNLALNLAPILLYTVAGCYQPVYLKEKKYYT